MTQRSIHAGQIQTIIIKAGASVVVRGHDGDLVTANTRDRGGLQVEFKSEGEIGRARAAIGSHVLLDWRLKRPDLKYTGLKEIIQVQIGGSGDVFVPYSSNLKIYAGKDIDVQDIRGQVDAFSGFSLRMRNVYALGNASSGGAMDLDCQTLLGTDVTFGAGADLRFHIAGLINAHLRVKDLGGYWEARIGAGERSVYLKSGGDVTFVTDQTVEPQPPDYVLGQIEKPA